MPVGNAWAAGTLDITVNGPYNLVVDSNVCSNSTFAPEVASHSIEICNFGDAPLTDVVAHVGDFANMTPGVYPARDSSTGGVLCSQSPHLCDSGSYSLTHLGGSVDATRIIGTLDVGQCSVQYWSFTYPTVENGGCGDPVFGTSDVSDDLTLDYDVWVTSAEGVASDDSRTVAMRSQIQASANKIFPNGGTWFTDPAQCTAGSIIATNGVNYELGVVNGGFDNDGDGEADNNVWLQPIGAASWDPACFRLVRTSGQLQVSLSGGGEQLINFENQLYFTNLPANNGITGQVTYEFACLSGSCQVPLSPYQTAGSGSSNEKFAGDYGVFTTSLETGELTMVADKSVTDGADERATVGETLTYDISVTNTGSTNIGAPDFGVPLVISDPIPEGTVYNGMDSFTLMNAPAGCCSLATLYSTDGGVSWTSSKPAPAQVTDIQWRFEDPFPPGATVELSFQAVVQDPPDPVIFNTAAVSVGDSPPALEASAGIVVGGANEIGDTVFADDGAGADANNGTQDAGESVIAGVAFALWWDRDADGILSSADVQVDATTSGGAATGCSGTGNYCFAGIADGDFLVIADSDSLPAMFTGYRLTTAGEILIQLPTPGGGTPPTAADFGFGPSLSVVKTATSGDPALAGDLVTYEIAVTNNRPAADVCEFLVWGESFDAGFTAASNPANATGTQGPDDVFATLGEGGGGDDLRITDFGGNSYPGTITSVEVVFRVFVEKVLTDDDLDFFVNDGTSASSLFTLDAAFLNANALNQWYLHSEDVTGNPDAWDPATEFPNSFVDFNYKHNGASDNAPIRVDAAGFRVTTDATCGAPSDNMSVVPLEDTFDATLLTFVSATDCGTSTGLPACGDTDDVIDLPDSQVPAGTLSWTNVGPLDAGRTTVYQITFMAGVPPDSSTFDGNLDGEPDPASLLNTATSAAGTFVDGGTVNTAIGSDTITLQPTGSIGDRIFNDNGATPGVEDAGEAGIPNVTVELQDGICTPGVDCPTTITDANGFYLFEFLLSGTYTVVVDTGTLPGVFGGSTVQTADPDATLDNSGTVTLDLLDGDLNNNDVDTVDFGYTIPNTIYGTILEDVDGDGVIDAGDNGIGGVTVELQDGVCSPGVDCPTDVTAADGSYSFTDLAGGDYEIVVIDGTLPAGGSWSATIDPDASVDGRTTVAGVSGGNVFGAFDFAYHQTGSTILGDTVYADWNGDGDQDPAEEGIANITVSLYEDANGNGQIDPLTDALAATTVTDANGLYSFAGLPGTNGGEAWLVVVDESDSDWPYATNQTQDPDEPGVCSVCSGSAVVMTDGVTNNLDVDFGYQPTGTGVIGDLVFVDADGDGLFDVGESGLANITVTLYEDMDGDGVIDAEDQFIEATISDGAGAYAFFSLPAGGFIVDVDTNDPQIPVDSFGNPLVLSTGNDPLGVILADGQNFLTADFGFAPGGRIGDLVYLDNDGNGDFDPSDVGINGVLVELYLDANGNGVAEAGELVASTTTATDAVQGDGYYVFTGLPPGDYIVDVDAGSAAIPAASTLTGDPENNCPGGPGCDGLAFITLSPASGALFADFGFQAPGSIAGTLWIEDLPTNDTFDAGEDALANVLIELQDGACTSGADCPTTTTDASGNYSFGNLAAGTYTVVVDPAGSTLPANLTQSLDPDGTLDAQTAVDVDLGVNNGNVSGVDFAYTQGPQLTIDKDTLTPTVSQGGQVQYRIRIRNAGGSTVTGATVSDTLPASGSASCAGNGCFTLAEDPIQPGVPDVTISESPNVVRTATTGPAVGDSVLNWGTWNIPAGDSVTITFTVDVDVNTPLATYDNPATATASNIPVSPIDDDPLAGQDADTPVGQDPETDEDVTVAGLPELDVVKETDSGDGLDCFAGTGDGQVLPGDTITYCVTLTNVGAATAHSISVSDAVPTGTTLVSATILSMPVSNLTTSSDNFNDGAFPNGGSGFASAWTADGAAVVTDMGDASLEIGRNDDPDRDVSVTGADSATLRFSYRRFEFDGGDDLVVSFCGNTVGTITGVSDGGSGTDQTDFSYITREFDLTPALTGDPCTLEFDSNANGNAEIVYVDDVVVSVGMRSTDTNVPVTPPTLIAGSGDFELRPFATTMESITIELEVTVDDPVVGITSIDNTVFASSTEVGPVSANVSDTIINAGGFTVSGTVFDDNGGPDGDTKGDGNFDPDEPGLENVRVELIDCGADDDGSGNPCGDGDDVQLAVTLTAADGTFAFANVPDGDYRINIVESTLPTSYFLTTGNEPDDITVAGGDITNLEYGYEEILITVPVTLASLNTTLEDDRLVVEWTTATEVGNVGFYLYGNVDGRWLELSDELIPSRVVDSSSVTRYRIELPPMAVSDMVVVDVDVFGEMTVHGPFAPQQMAKSQPPPREPIPWKQISLELENRRLARLAEKGEAGDPVVRFSVSEEGIYRVSYEDILAAGLDLNRVAPKDLVLTDGAGEVPMRIVANGRFGPGSAIEFVGQPISTLYADTNLYTLRVAQGGARIGRDNTQPRGGEAVTTYQHTTTLAPDNAYSIAASNGDPWYDQRLFARGGPDSAFRTLEAVDLAASGTASVSAEVWGMSSWDDTSPDHHVRLLVNGVEVSDHFYDGRQAATLTSDVGLELLTNGPVEIGVFVPGDVDAAWDLMALEGVSLTYPRQLRVREATLVFDATAGPAYEITGLTSENVVVYRASELGVEELRAKVSGVSGNHVVRIAGFDRPARYYVSEVEALLSPVLEVVTVPELPAPEPADYLVVTHPSFEAGIAPLVEHREAQGLRVTVVTTEQIYAAHSGGVMDAEAIRQYIVDATAQQGVRYVLLVGGDTYDYLDHFGLGSISFVPSLYIPSGDIVQFAPADAMYGVPTPGGVPQLPVGRLPVRTAAELDNSIDKILAYESKTYGRTALAAADRDDRVNDISFRDEGEQLLDTLGDGWTIERAYVDELGVAEAKQVILQSLNSGVALAQYFGHSSPTLWSFDRLLTTDDIRGLDNTGRPATVVQWGCWNTYYVDPTANTLGHVLMFSEGGGAAAVIGAATLTETISDVELGRRYMPLLGQSGRTIGEALVWAKQALAEDRPELFDVVVGWAILGDPAMVIEPR